MTTDTQDVFVRRARKHWPTAVITGTGSFALVAYCCTNKTVRLFELYPEAKMLEGQPCGHAFCRLNHKLYRIQPLEDGQAYQAAHTVGYGRD